MGVAAIWGPGPCGASGLSRAAQPAESGAQEGRGGWEAGGDTDSGVRGEKGVGAAAQGASVTPRSRAEWSRPCGEMLAQ